MRKKELIKKMREYQSWRKGADIPMMPPSEVTRIIDSAITGSLAAQGQSSCTGAVEVITLCGGELPSDYDISDAVIIDGDIHCRSISCNGIVVCKGSYTVIEEGGDYGSL